MPCACNSRKKIKYVNPQIHPLPTIGSNILAQKKKPPIGTRYPTIQEIRRNPSFFLRKKE